MTTTNPCFSCCSHTVKDKPCPKGTCLSFCDIYISPKNDLAVGCGETGTLLMTDYENDTSVCEDNVVTYQVVMYDTTFFTYASVDSAGQLSWIPTVSTSITGNVVVKVSCGCLSKFVTITIGVKKSCSPQCPTTGKISGDVTITIK